MIYSTELFTALHYLPYRLCCSFFSSILLGLIGGCYGIKKLKQQQMQQFVRKEGPKTHYKKEGTPTMGGLIIIAVIWINAFLWLSLSNPYVMTILATMTIFACIGGYDDWLKIKKKHNQGLTARGKFFLQCLFALIISLVLWQIEPQILETHLVIPFVRQYAWFIGLGFIPLALFIIIGSCNALNLTDGLDGLAISQSFLLFAGLGCFAFLSSNILYAHHFALPYLPHGSDIAVLCAIIVGSCLAFFWFNSFPAEVFMGDVGSLSLGACLGVIAVILRQELLFCLMSLILVLEVCSVIIQVASYKLRKGKKVFLMAPIHHHFELKGNKEPKIVVRFWLITLVFVLIAITTLLLR